MRVYLDTNIIIDFLSGREPFGVMAKSIFILSEEQKIELFANSHSMATLYYILRKGTNEQDLRDKTDAILDYISIIAIEKKDLKESIQSQTKDFEDAIQIISAQKAHADFLITRNVKDFKTSSIRVLSPDQFINMFQ